MSPMYLDYFVNTTSPMYNFDVDSEHEDHSEELLLFVGCIVNFIVSYLICMFQDSVPAGSYNDPFLSSVCVWGQPLFPRDLQICKLFNFSILGQGVQAAHPVLHQRRHWMSAGHM